MSFDLFVSYAEADRSWVEGFLIDALSKAGVRCQSESSFRLGAPRLQEFQRAIAQSTHILLVISQAYLADDVSQFVDLLAQSYGQDTQTWPVIPLVRQPTALPPRLAMLVGLRATTPAEQEAAVDRLCADLQHPVAPATKPPPCPYPGMVPFSEADQQSFFGRDRENNELVNRLRVHPFVTVIGPSGSGKSSLVFAGLVPLLRTSDVFGPGDWLVRSMRPGVTPLDTLASLLGGDAEDLPDAINRLVAAGEGDTRLLLIIDQYEELFSLGGTQSDAFQRLIQSLVAFPGCFIVLTVRADFYADLMSSPIWHVIQNSRMEVLPLAEEGLREAIVRPAERVGVFIEPVLIERLLDDAAGEPGVLPLVQETLVLIWERIERRFLPLRAYEALVLPVGAYNGPQGSQRSGLQVAISLRADAALASLSPDPSRQVGIARDILLRLVQFGEGRADTRRRQQLNDLATVCTDRGLFSQTLEHLIHCRLLTSNKDEGGSADRCIDIAHEALIQSWPMLQSWIAEKREAEQVRRRLSEKAREWKRLGSGHGGLLDAVELTEVERWRSGCSEAEADPLLLSFLQSSHASVNHQRRRRQLAIGTMASVLVVGVAVLGFARRQVAERNTIKTMLDVQLGNKPTSMAMITPSLDAYLEEAHGYRKRAAADPNPADPDVRFQESRKQGIIKARAVLDTVFRVENGNYALEDLSSIDTKSLADHKAKAEQLMNELIVPYAITKIREPLQRNLIGKVETDTTYLRFDDKFSKGSALEATYQVIMIDLGADINRIGTLSPNETKRIPCTLLLAIEDLWQHETGDCGWYGPGGRWNGRKGCTSDGTDRSLGALVFPDISYSNVRKRLNTCKVRYAQF